MIPLKPLETNNRTLELYSSRRNRNIYPNPSSFVANFAPTVHPHCGEKIINDPVCSGSIYYTFDWNVQKIDNVNYIPFAIGKFGVESSQANPVLIFKEDDNYNIRNNIGKVSRITDYFVSFLLYRIDTGVLTEYKTIQTYNPSSGVVSLNRPFNNTLVLDDYSNGFVLFSNLPFEWVIDIPSVDLNGMLINKSPLYYNGYYVVFETPNSEYSNSTNSNIFARRISYYDYETQQAYLDSPIPFIKYYDENPYQNRQVWTLRKSLPLERWTLNKQSYYKNTRSTNILCGPFPGYVVVLPDEASSIDNYYRGKYIYVVSNHATTYSPPLPPQEDTLPIDGAFYPIYGLFYIRAYNGTTKELSIQVINNKYENVSKSIPTYNIVNSTFRAGSGCQQIVDVGGVFQAYPQSMDLELRLLLDLKRDKTYRITWNVKKVSDPGSYDITFETDGGVYVYFPYNNGTIYLTDNYQMFTFEMTMSSNSDVLEFINFFQTPDLNFYIEWDMLFIEEISVINIVDSQYDNYAPLDYNGTMVSTNETVCYEMSIQSLTLPNKELATGSSIAFYPFVYVEIENFTSPSGASPNIIISNNPPSTKAVFTIYIPQVNNASQQKFVSLYGGGTQIVKFKPNDNLKFSVFLPDGTSFSTLLPDTLTPYPADPSLQIQAVFNLVRVN
jgi:hypothetical protein